MIKSEDIINIANYFNIISHTPGRLRVRVSLKIKNESNNIKLSDIENLPDKIEGINSIKINKLMASVTIMYDPKIFAPKLWEDLIKQENTEELTVLINTLAKEV